MAVASGRPSHVVGLHFFNPVQMMKLVEVVRTDATDPAVLEECTQWAQKIGKQAVSCRDTPGFIVNRWALDCRSIVVHPTCYDLNIARMDVTVLVWVLILAATIVHRIRLLIPGLAQGMLMLDRGDGSIEDIDRSLELGAGHPMGPLTLAVSHASDIDVWYRRVRVQSYLRAFSIIFACSDMISCRTT